MHGYLKKLVDERNALTGLMQTIADRAVSEDRDLTEPEQGQLREYQNRCAAIDKEASEQKQYLDGMRNWANLQTEIRAQADVPDQKPRTTAAVARREAGAVVPFSGSAFTDSDAFRSYPGFGSSARAELPGILTRAPIDTSFLDVPAHVYVPAPWQPTSPLLDVVGRERVSTNSVEWITYPPSFPVAGVVAEGALKPEATITPTQESATLNTYAHWVGITRQALEDIPRIQSIIENQLRGGIFAKLEADTGVLLAGETGFQQVDTNPDPGGGFLGAIRVAIGLVQEAGYATPNGILLNPSDYAALDVAVMEGGVSGPVRQTTFWGIRTIASARVPVGTAYVGDFSVGLTLFDRSQTSVYLTDSHADNFIRNVLVILAEARALPVVTQPAAIVRVTDVLP